MRIQAVVQVDSLAGKVKVGTLSRAVLALKNRGVLAARRLLTCISIIKSYHMASDPNHSLQISKIIIIIIIFDSHY